MLYFAYGSNMCTERLQQRVPSANPVRIAKLLNHSLRFHKRSTDGSAKCDAYFTGERQDVIWGVIFEIDLTEKPSLDAHEGLGHGYAEKQITVIDADGNYRPLFMYAAEETHIDPTLRPYSWYKRFVIEGARFNTAFRRNTSPSSRVWKHSKTPTRHATPRTAAFIAERSP